MKQRGEETERIEGYWSFDIEGKRKVPGVLELSPGDFHRLRLLGSLDPPEKGFGSQKRSTIFGRSLQGQKYTLCRAGSNKYALNLPGHATQSFTAGVVLVGGHFPDDLSTHWSSIKVQYDGLEEWVHRSGFSGWGQIGEGGTHELKYTHPETASAALSDGTEIEISFIFDPGSSVSPGVEYRLRQRCYLRITPVAPMTLQALLDLAGRARDFVALGLGSPLKVRETSLRCVDPNAANGADLSNSWVDVRHMSADSQPWLSPSEGSSIYHLDDVATGIADCLSNWFEKYEHLKPTFNLLASVEYSREMYSHLRFLSLVQATETFHRRTRPGYDLREALHTERIQNILSLTPKQYRGWLQDKLNYSNEITLRQRLNSLAEEYSAHLERELGTVKEFVDLVTDSRNYYTHYSDDLREKAATGLKLYLTVVRLTLLLKIMLLSEAGFPPAILEKQVKVFAPTIKSLKQQIEQSA
ncbi:MAG: HEPN domain-containing protein [bacterium]